MNQKKKRGQSMLIPTIIMGVLAVGLLFLTYQKGMHTQALKISGNLFLQMLPLLFFALVVAGAIQMLLPQETISKWVGTESGLRGVFIGTILGGLAPGGPYVNLPIAAGLLRMGASIGTMVAFLTGWSLIAVARLPMEIGLLGWKFSLIRITCVFFFPPIAGIIANALFSRVNVL